MIMFGQIWALTTVMRPVGVSICDSIVELMLLFLVTHC